MVRSQSTKGLSFAIRSGGDHVADLDITVCDDDAIDQQFEQLALAVEVGLLQAVPHASAEHLGLVCEPSSFALTVSVLQQFALLAIKRRQSTFSITTTSFVL